MAVARRSWEHAIQAMAAGAGTGQQTGLIPARAGSTSHGSSGLDRDRAHPRSVKPLVVV